MSDLVIPGVETVHQRSWWEESAYRVTGPRFPRFVDIADSVQHYPGDEDVPDGSNYEGHVRVELDDDLREYIRATQRAYVNGRRYSVGYGFAVDYLGGATVLRGFDFKNAANKGSKLQGNWNDRSCAIWYITDAATPLTPFAEHTGAMITAEMRRRGARATVRPHDYGEWTLCPGPVKLSLDAGRLDPDYYDEPEPEPEPEPPEEDEEMTTHIRDSRPPHAEYVSNGSSKTWLNQIAAADYSRARHDQPGQFIETDDDELIASYGAIVGPIPDGFDAWGRKLT